MPRVKSTQFWRTLGSLPGLRRRDEASVAAIESTNPNASIVYVAQTKESREALASHAAGFDLQWAGVLGVTSENICLWQCTKNYESQQVFNAQWNDVHDLGLASVRVWNRSIPTLQLTFDPAEGTRLITPFIVREGVGSAIGLGSGQRINAVEKAVASHRDRP